MPLLPVDTEIEIDLSAPRDEQLRQAQMLASRIAQNLTTGGGIDPEITSRRTRRRQLRVTAVVDTQEEVARTVERIGADGGEHLVKLMEITAGGPRGWPIWRRYTNLAHNATLARRRRRGQRAVRRRARPHSAGQHSAERFELDHKEGLILINNKADHAPTVRYGATYKDKRRKKRRGTRAFHWVWESFVATRLRGRQDELAKKLLQGVRRDAREERLKTHRAGLAADRRWRRTVARR